MTFYVEKPPPHHVVCLYLMNVGENGLACGFDEHYTLL